MATILCVEDEEDLRETIAEELQDAGYTVIEAGDGTEGLRLAIEHKPDLVLSDITMPEMDGFEMLRQIRAHHPRLADVPVIFLSALAERSAVLEGVKVGADDYLTKPVDFDMMRAKIEAKIRMSCRMIERKQQEHVKLYRALKQNGSTDDIKPTTDQPRRIVLVGRGDPELNEVNALLCKMGHNTHVFTSGSAYLCWVKEGKVKAELTLLWFHTDDMQAPMIRKLAVLRASECALVIPSKLNRTGVALDHAGFSRTLVLPTDSQQIDALIDATCRGKDTETSESLNEASQTG